MALMCTFLILYSLSIKIVFITYLLTAVSWTLIGFFAFQLKSSITTQLTLLFPIFIISIVGVFFNNKLFPLFTPTVFIISLASYNITRLISRRKIFTYFLSSLIVICVAFIFFKNFYNKRQRIQLFKDISFNNITLKKNDNNNYLINKDRPKVIIIDFWYSKCYPCITEFNKFKELSINYSSLEFINICDGEINSFKDFMSTTKKYDLNTNNTIALFDSAGLLAAKMRVLQFPTYAIILKTNEVHVFSNISDLSYYINSIE